MTKKKTKKSKKKYNKKKLWGLEKLTFPKTVQHYMDQDYISKLSDKDKAWLSKFNEEWYGNKLSNKTKKSKSKRKQIYDSTNARNRDVYNLHSRSYLNSEFKGTIGDENSTIDYVDATRNLVSYPIDPDSE